MSVKKEVDQIFWESLKVLDNQHWITDSFKGRGDIEFGGNLRFSGQWTGSIQSTHPEAHLYVMKDAKFRGHIRVPTLSVEGSLEDVEVDAEYFRALPGSRIFGKVRAQNILIEEGALIEGRVVAEKKA